MSHSFMALPSVGVVNAGLVLGETFVVGVVPHNGFFDRVTMRFADAPNDFQSITFRVGPDLSGALNVDFIEILFVGDDAILEGVELFDTNQIALTAGDVISWTVFARSGTVAGSDFSGSVRIQSEDIAVFQTGDYTTLDRVKDSLGLGALTSAQDSDITDIISSVSSLFDTIYGDRFKTAEIEELHDGSSLTNGIPLYREPSELQADRDLATLREDGTLLTLGTEWLLDPAENFGSRMVWRITGAADTAGRFNARFAAGFRNIKVVYKTWPGVIPADVALAATEETIRYFMNTQITNATDGLRIGIASRSPETGTSLNYVENDLLPATVRMLNAYRRRRFPG